MISMADTALASNWYSNELPYGWAGELTYPNVTNFDHHFQLYKDMTLWIEKNVHRYNDNAKWIKIGDCIYIQFRKKKDMMWFVLRFGL